MLQDGGNPLRQLVGRNGLHEIIIGIDIEPFPLRLVVGDCCQEEKRGPVPLFADLVEERDPVHFGHQDIAEDHIGPVDAEKLRTLLQTQQKLTHRGWNRPRARDYYDLWRLFTTYGDDMDREKLAPLLKRKCELRKVKYHSAADFFTEDLLSEAKTHWNSSLGTFVADLPPFQETIDDLRNLLSEIIP